MKLKIGGGGRDGDESHHSDDSFDKIDRVEDEKKEAASKTTTPTAESIRRAHQPLVQEVDVRRGREVVQAHSGSAGSLCLVVRRPS